MRRTFRYDPVSGTMVEVKSVREVEQHAIHGEIEPFISPRDGTVIRSRTHLREYMTRHDLVHFDPTHKRVEDRYETARQDRELRERLYEYVDRLVTHGRGPNQ